MPGPFPRGPFFDPFLVKVVLGILVAILGLSGVAAVDAALHPGCRFREYRASVVRSAATFWQLAENDYRTCPSLQLLVRDRHLEPTEAAGVEDTMAIFCHEGEVMVRWAGPDETFGTADDATAPE